MNRIRRRVLWNGLTYALFGVLNSRALAGPVGVAKVSRCVIVLAIAGFVGYLSRASDAEDLRPRPDAQAKAESFKIVADYVQRTRGWPISAYTLKLNRRKAETVVFWVLYKDDDFSNPGGGGKSFAVVLDSSTNRVEQELYFQ